VKKNEKSRLRELANKYMGIYKEVYFPLKLIKHSSSVISSYTIIHSDCCKRSHKRV
jgi:hypothetical protein